MKTIVIKFISLSFLVLCWLFLSSFESSAQQARLSSIKTWNIKISIKGGLLGRNEVISLGQAGRLKVTRLSGKNLTQTIVVPKLLLAQVESSLRELNSSPSETAEKNDNKIKQCRDCIETNYSIKADNRELGRNSAIENRLWEIVQPFYNKASDALDKKRLPQIQKGK